MKGSEILIYMMKHIYSLHLLQIYRLYLTIRILLIPTVGWVMSRPLTTQVHWWTYYATDGKSKTKGQTICLTLNVQRTSASFIQTQTLFLALFLFLSLAIRLIVSINYYNRIFASTSCMFMKLLNITVGQVIYAGLILLMISVWIKVVLK